MWENGLDLIGSRLGPCTESRNTIMNFGIPQKTSNFWLAQLLLSSADWFCSLYCIYTQCEIVALTRIRISISSVHVCGKQLWNKQIIKLRLHSSVAMYFIVHCSDSRGANGGRQWYAAQLQHVLGQHLSGGGLCRWQQCMWFRRLICRKPDKCKALSLLKNVIYCYHQFIWN